MHGRNLRLNPGMLSRRDVSNLHIYSYLFYRGSWNIPSSCCFCACIYNITISTGTLYPVQENFWDCNIGHRNSCSLSIYSRIWIFGLDCWCTQRSSIRWAGHRSWFLYMTESDRHEVWGNIVSIFVQIFRDTVSMKLHGCWNHWTHMNTSDVSFGCVLHTLSVMFMNCDQIMRSRRPCWACHLQNPILTSKALFQQSRKEVVRPEVHF